MDMKSQIIDELDRRVDLLTKSQNKQIKVTGNQYEELNQAIGKVIGAPLIGELKDIRTFVQKL